MHGVGRHAQTQVSQIAKGCIALPHKHRRLVDDSLAHWKPVHANKNRHDVVVAMSPGDQAGNVSLLLCTFKGHHVIYGIKSESQLQGESQTGLAETNAHAFTIFRLYAILFT